MSQAVQSSTYKDSSTNERQRIRLNSVSRLKRAVLCSLMSRRYRKLSERQFSTLTKRKCLHKSRQIQRQSSWSNFQRSLLNKRRCCRHKRRETIRDNLPTLCCRQRRNQTRNQFRNPSLSNSPLNFVHHRALNSWKHLVCKLQHRQRA